MRLDIPEGAGDLIKRLNDSGYKAYAVGGCVRDSILGRAPKDWDLATDAQPREVKALFEKTADTGLKHGTVTVVLNGESYELTTFRVDGEYLDGRHPSGVRYADSLAEDLGRRDFTVNAMAYHPVEGLVDPFGGMDDLKAGVIRTVGAPEERFGEDALRMLRAVRFSARLSFELDPAVLSAIKKCRRLILKISSERIRSELDGIITSERPSKLMLLQDTGLLELLLPELAACFTTEQNNPWHIYNVGTHTVKSMEHIENRSLLRWVMLLHDTGKPACRSTDSKGVDHFYGHPFKSAKIAESILTRLRFDRAFIEKAVRLVRLHDLEIAAEPVSIKKAVLKAGGDLFEDLLKVMEADKRAQNPRKLSDRLDVLHRIREIYAGIREEKQCVSLKQLAVDGNDLLELGFTEGARIGRLLNMLLEAVIERPELNSKEKLLELVKIKERPS